MKLKNYPTPASLIYHDESFRIDPKIDQDIFKKLRAINTQSMTARESKIFSFKTCPI